MHVINQYFTVIHFNTNSPFRMFATCLSQTLIKYSLINTFSSKSYFVIKSGRVMTSQHPGNFCMQGTTDMICCISSVYGDASVVHLCGL